ncbi:hypothetical protein OZ411_15015 [Bradyrhizobium sp. Arg237L]|uniref:hypothetical protein n=1 Tax=Bradyrhizobium sp. Arg237L TaxID=3003352 RepID=UPI00249E24D1|nr:hypothetical protein [Bradyrhizobium sp. Arg237L]MDI4234123.1 hypothetical protein [Bradyrhizobium sp. Arg237L]
MVVLYVLDVKEFLPIVETARKNSDFTVSKSDRGYYRISSPTEIILNRKAMNMKPAVWYGLFTGGMNGEIAEFGREEVRVIGTNRPL